MAMQGNLQDMAVADLIQHNCQDRKTARLIIEHNDQQATLFFNEGSVQHAALGDTRGEEVIYRILNWQEGRFILEMGLEPPAVTITRSWSGLLLEGAKRLDEETQLSTIDSIPLNQENVTMATRKKKSELLADALAEMLADSSDIEGSAIIGLDGLVYSINVPVGKLDEGLIGAAGAALVGLSKRSVEQMERGDFNQTLVQGSKGNLIVTFIDDQTLLLGLTAANVNIGMAFSETRALVAKLQGIL